MSYQTKIVPQYPPAGSSETSVTILTTVGNPGPQGPTGSKWFEGSGAPASSLGNNFDFYLDDDTGDVYQKTSGSWSKVANIEGPAEVAWIVKTSAYTASAFDRILADTSGGAFTINLPSTPSTGDMVYFADGARTWHNFSLTVDGNGNNIMDDTELVANNRDESFALVYNGTQWVLGIN